MACEPPNLQNFEAPQPCNSHLECVHPQQPLPTGNNGCVVGYHVRDPIPVSKPPKGVQGVHVASAQGQRMYVRGLGVGIRAVAGALQLVVEQDGLKESDKQGVCIRTEPENATTTKQVRIAGVEAGPL
jgi:hypothetical protein